MDASASRHEALDLIRHDVRNLLSPSRISTTVCSSSTCTRTEHMCVHERAETLKRKDVPGPQPFNVQIDNGSDHP